MDFNEIKQLLDDNEDTKVLDYLKQSYKIKISQETHEPECLDATQSDIKLLKYVIRARSTHFPLVKEAFRCLRNSVIKNSNIQNEILQKDDLLDGCKDILLLGNSPIDLKNMVLTCLLNICIGHQENATTIWKSFDFIVLSQDKTISNKLYALIYNILLINPDIKINIDIINNLLSQLKKNDANEELNEFAHFTLELLIKNGSIFLYFNDIKIPEDRIRILQHFRELQLKKEEVKLNKDDIQLLSRHFKEKSDCILKTVADYVDKIEPYEVSLLADVLSSLTSDEKLLKVLQYDRSLLINCAFLLKSIHDAGKEGSNHFAPIGKLSKTEEMKEDIQSHPAFGFQVNMIRILGNLAWKCRCNQDEMRELDIIPLLLDCCKIDGRNPFIIQWVVFAIRNLCENNIDNQNIIASLNKQGVVDSTMLNELRLTLHDDGPNSINIAPLNLNSN